VKPFLLVLSAPSGGGKSSIARNLLQGRDDLGYSVSATTRPMREGERDGVDYHFLSREEFLRRRDAGEFLESATYGGHLYGTLRSEIERLFAAGRHAVLDIEIEGARQIRASFSNSLHVFVLPPSAEVLIGRLRGRNTEPPEVVRERITRAADELLAVAEYDYALVNQDLVVAVAQVAAILDAEARRVAEGRRHRGREDLVTTHRQGARASCVSPRPPKSPSRPGTSTSAFWSRRSSPGT
jgi:guanylate kinase